MFMKCTFCDIFRDKFCRRGEDFFIIHTKYHNKNLNQSGNDDADDVFNESGASLLDMFLSTSVSFGRP